jgi:preprotein translocase subunit SecB
MADQPENTPSPAENGDAAKAAGADLAPQMGIELQYVKDLSFENLQGPNTPNAVQQNPDVRIEINTNARPLDAGRYEVTLFIRAEAKTKDAPIFIAELTYAGVFVLSNVPDDALGAVLLIEGPRLLFPFARNIIADATREGGVPPLLINPVDFVQLFQDRQAEAAANGTADA